MAALWLAVRYADRCVRCIEMVKGMAYGIEQGAENKQWQAVSVG